MSGGGGGHRYLQMQSEPPSTAISSAASLRLAGGSEDARIFDELPEATIVSVSRPDAADISPMLLSYTIEFRYKQVSIVFIFFAFASFTFEFLFIFGGFFEVLIF